MSALTQTAPLSVSRSQMHLTARGRQALRLLRTVVFALVILGGAYLVATQSMAAGAVTAGQTVGIDAGTVVVSDGDSLWSVASELGLDRDTREVIGDIVELNHLTTSVVHPGQVLDVPRQ